MRRLFYSLLVLLWAVDARSNPPLADAVRLLRPGMIRLNNSACTCGQKPTRCFLMLGDVTIDSVEKKPEETCSNTCNGLLTVYARDGGICSPLPTVRATDVRWERPYHIHRNHCHHAANAGVTSCGNNTRVLACNARALTNPNLVHTVNIQTWACRPHAVRGCVAYCIFEPQSGNNGAGCCWEQKRGGAAQIRSGLGLGCTREMCMGQADGTQTVIDRAPVGLETCVEGRGNFEGCTACCRENTWRNEAGADVWARDCDRACHMRWKSEDHLCGTMTSRTIGNPEGLRGETTLYTPRNLNPPFHCGTANGQQLYCCITNAIIGSYVDMYCVSWSRCSDNYPYLDTRSGTAHNPRAGGGGH